MSIIFHRFFEDSLGEKFSFHILETKNFTDFTEKYFCEHCHIKCTRNKEWERHILTAKHLKKTNWKGLEENFTTEKD